MLYYLRACGLEHQILNMIRVHGWTQNPSVAFHFLFIFFIFKHQRGSADDLSLGSAMMVYCNLLQ